MIKRKKRKKRKKAIHLRDPNPLYDRSLALPDVNEMKKLYSPRSRARKLTENQTGISLDLMINAELEVKESTKELQNTSNFKDKDSSNDNLEGGEEFSPIECPECKEASQSTAMENEMLQSVNKFGESISDNLEQIQDAKTTEPHFDPHNLDKDEFPDEGLSKRPEQELQDDLVERFLDDSGEFDPSQAVQNILSTLDSPSKLKHTSERPKSTLNTTDSEEGKSRLAVSFPSSDSKSFLKSKPIWRNEDFEEDFILPIVNDNEIQVFCGFKDCSKCCHETEMLLSSHDLKRLQIAGYNPDEFCLKPEEADGFWQLKNVDGKCYFLSKTGKCTVYDIRPEGCRLYPFVMVLETDEIIIDADCREEKWFWKQEYARQQEKAIRSLASTIILEQTDTLFDITNSSSEETSVS